MATDRCFFFSNAFHFYCNLFCYLLTYLFTYLFFYFLLCINVVDLLSIKKEKKNQCYFILPRIKTLKKPDPTFNSWITLSVRNELLWTLRYASVSLGCRHLSQLLGSHENFRCQNNNCRRSIVPVPRSRSAERALCPELLTL